MNQKSNNFIFSKLFKVAFISSAALLIGCSKGTETAYEIALKDAQSQYASDVVRYKETPTEVVPDGLTYESNGYYFKAENGYLVQITKDEYEASKTPKIKNLIFMIPDGAGFGTYDYANTYKKKVAKTAVDGICEGVADDANHRQATPITTNRIEGKTVKELYLDKYLIAHADTNLNNPQVAGTTDSAAAGTALLCGKKTNYLSVGVTPDFSPLANLLEVARLSGKATGAVSTKSLIDATTSDMVAHSLKRPDQDTYAYQPDVCQQILNNNIDVQLMYGTDGGYMDAGGYQSTYDNASKHGYTVVNDLNSMNKAVDEGKKKIFSKIQIDYAKLASNTNYDIATENYYYVNYPYDRDFQGQHILFDVDAREGDLTLLDMTKAAIKALDQNVNNPNGFVLVIEGGAIDNACETRRIKEGVAEYLAFDEAWGYAVNYAMKDGETMVVGCPDHDSGGFYNQDNDVTKAPSSGTKNFRSVAALMTALHDGTIDDIASIAGDNSGHTDQDVPVWAYVPGDFKSKFLTNLNLPLDATAAKVRTGKYCDDTVFDPNYKINNSDIAHAITKVMGLKEMEEATEELFVPVYDDNDPSKYNYGEIDNNFETFTFSNGAEVYRNRREYKDASGNKQKIKVGLPIFLTNPAPYILQDGSNVKKPTGQATSVFYVPKSVLDDLNITIQK